MTTVKGSLDPPKELSTGCESYSYTVALGHPAMSLVGLSVLQVALLKGITVSLGGVNMLLI